MKPKIKKRKFTSVVLAVLTVSMLAMPPAKASAGPLLCAATATGGAVVAFLSLFTGPGIFVTAPTILSATGVACFAPTP